MPRYRIGRDYDSSGVTDEKVIEADTQEEAEEMALEYALEPLEAWADLVEDTLRKEEDDNGE